LNHQLAPLLAEATSPAFLMSVAKPLVTFATFVPYAIMVSTKLEKDAGYFNLKPQKWAAIFMAFGIAGLLAALLVPFWLAGYPLMVALFVAPCMWYMKFRNAELKGTKAKPLTFLDIDFGKMSADRRAKAALAGAALRFQNKDRSEQPVPERKDPNFEVYSGLEGLIMGALAARAARVEIGLSKQGAQVQNVVDSVRYKRDPIAGELATKVVDMLKGFAGLDAAERRKFQRGTVAVVRDGNRIILTVTSVGSMQGETVRIDVEREKQLTIPLDKLGMSEQQIKLLNDTINADPRGVVLVGTRPGQGLTTLSYALLGRHDSLTSNIKTLERRFERVVEGVEHADFDPAKSDYSTQLQSIIRRGPDVVFVADAADPGCAKVICAPNSRGSLFYVGMPSDSVPDILAAWAKAAGDPKAAAEPLRLVVTQRIVRKLCMSCRAPYAPSPAEQKMLAIPAGKQIQLYKQSGKVLVKEQPVDCPTCKGTGFIGSFAVVEVLPFDDASRALLATGDVKGAYMQARRTFKCPSLQDSALIKVRAGETSFDEVKRVFAPPAAAPAAAAKPAAAPAAAPKKQ
jgi:type II secretory ATPase GspE/PulE/Tfp pilus assembly ATPase PilB-like protein